MAPRLPTPLLPFPPPKVREILLHSLGFWIKAKSILEFRLGFHISCRVSRDCAKVAMWQGVAVVEASVRGTVH
jgi:hypothetical protein